MFRHQQGAFPFPELQFSRGGFNMLYFCALMQSNRGLGVEDRIGTPSLLTLFFFRRVNLQNGVM
jgi:hypothetical protein